MIKSKANLRRPATALMISCAIAGLVAVGPSATAAAPDEPLAGGGKALPPGCDPALEEISDKAARKGIENTARATKAQISPPFGVKELSCLDDILNVNFSLSGSLPSMDAIMRQIAKRICSAADGMWDKVNDKLGEELTFPGAELPGGIQLPATRIKPGIEVGRGQSGSLRDSIENGEPPVSLEVRDSLSGQWDRNTQRNRELMNQMLGSDGAN